MPAHRADNHFPSNAAAPWPTPTGGGAAGGRAYGPGSFLTDEVFLYRILRCTSTQDGAIVELEDCYWLDIVSIPLNELRARRLRVVTPAPTAGRSESTTNA